MTEPAGAVLETAFRAIAASRMAGLPIVNPALAVEAVDFRPGPCGLVGVLITPWCMNLTCLPGPDSEWARVPVGVTRRLPLPSGEYAFIGAFEPALGPYLAASLFSPMFEFPDQAAARAVARAALAEVFAPPEGLAARLERPVSRRGFLNAWRGEGRP